jgi:hypothetical protein
MAVGPRSPGTSLQAAVLNDGAEERDAPSVPDPSSLLVAGEVLVGFSLPMFVVALIAAFGDRFKQSVGPTGNARPKPP